MSFLVTARKYRPAVFSDVVAQGHVVNTLMNAIRLGRIAHAYLFCGPRGVGKTTTARIFAKALNCRNAVDGEPCNRCDTCVEITEGRNIDVIEIDGASNNGVDQVRTIRDAVRYMPAREKYKLYIIDEVHMLSENAFNALLKTLEEPPAHALFIFATTEPHKIKPTVISRCQRFDFKRISTGDIMQQLRSICGQEHITADEDALFIIARGGDGSMRDAESIFDQVVSFAGTTLTAGAVRDVLHVVDQSLYFALTDLILAQDTKAGFGLAESVIMAGHDIQDFLSGLEEHFRNLLVARATGSTQLIDAPEESRERYAAVAPRFGEGDLLRLLRLTSDTMAALRSSTQPRVKFEVALISMIKMDSTVLISDLLARGGTSAKAPAKASAGTPAKASAGTAAGPATPAPQRAASAAPISREPLSRESLPPAADPARRLAQDESTYAAALRSGSRQELRMPPVAAAGRQHGTAPGEGSAEAPAVAPHPIVQLLMDNLGAVLLPNQHP